MASQTHLSPIQWAQLLADAWLDLDLKERIERDPTQTIRAWARDKLGIELQYALHLPQAPAGLNVEPLHASGPDGFSQSGAATAQLCGPACLFMPGGDGAAPPSARGGQPGPQPFAQAPVVFYINACGQAPPFFGAPAPAPTSAEAPEPTTSGVARWNLSPQNKKQS